jgi:hypothetical protein
MLNLRDKEAAERGDTEDYYSAHAVRSSHGMIYGAYHFPSGKWYVGQTINTIQERARQHWWARKSAMDYLHLTLADDPDPMCWVAFPLEKVPKERWVIPRVRGRLAGGAERESRIQKGRHPFGKEVGEPLAVHVAKRVELTISWEASQASPSQATTGS